MAPAQADFDRATRRVAPGDMPSHFRSALDRRAGLHGLEDLSLDGARAAAVTVSTPRSRGFLRRRREHTTWIVLAPEVLVVVGDSSGAPVASLYRLDGLEAKLFGSPLVADEGLDVTAMPVGGAERVSVFLPLAEGPVRDELLAALRGPGENPAAAG